MSTIRKDLLLLGGITDIIMYVIAFIPNINSNYEFIKSASHTLFLINPYPIIIPLLLEIQTFILT